MAHLYEQFFDILSHYDGKTVSPPTEVTEDIFLSEQDSIPDEEWRQLADSLGLKSVLERAATGCGNSALAALASLYGSLTEACSALDAKKPESMAEAQKLPLKKKSLTYEARREMRDSLLRDPVHLAEYLTLYADEEQVMDDLVLFEKALIWHGEISTRKREESAEIAGNLLELWELKAERLRRYGEAHPEEARVRMEMISETVDGIMQLDSFFNDVEAVVEAHLRKLEDEENRKGPSEDSLEDLNKGSTSAYGRLPPP